MCMCMCVCVCVCVRAHAQVCARERVRGCLGMHARAPACTCMCACEFARAYVCMSCVCNFECVFYLRVFDICVSLNVCMHICFCTCLPRYNGYTASTSTNCMQIRLQQ